MSGRMITLSLASLVFMTSGAMAQTLEQYDPAGYSGGYAEGASGPLGSEQLYPYDAQEQWQHGYIQYMPFYGGYKHFRPYNYKNVVSQAQTAAGWGMSPKMPYSQQYWHRYHAHARMSHPVGGAYQSLPVYRQPEQPAQNGYAPRQQNSGRIGIPAPQPVPRAPQVQQPLPLAPVPQNGALQFTPSPSYQPQGVPHTGISYQQAPQQVPLQLPAPGNTVTLPQTQLPAGQPLLIAP